MGIKYCKDKQANLWTVSIVIFPKYFLNIHLTSPCWWKPLVWAPSSIFHHLRFVITRKGGAFRLPFEQK